MMNYKEFETKLLEVLREEYPEADIMEREAVKVNRVLHGITVMNRNVGPTVYKEVLYNQYKKLCNGDFEKFMNGLRATLEIAEAEVPNTTPVFGSREAILSKIVAQIVNTEQNKGGLLRGVPSRQVCDLSIIYRILIGKGDNGVLSVVVTNDHARAFKLSEDDLYAAAVKNTRKISPVVVDDLVRMTLKMQGMSDEEIESAKANMPPCEQMFVITNEEKLNGAVMPFLYKDVLADIAESLDEDLWILPSSVHEIIVIPAGGKDAEELGEMVREINAAQVAIEERLSNNVYYYDRSTQEISQQTFCNETLGELNENPLAPKAAGY